MLFRKSHFVYSKRQRNGIFFLILLIAFSRFCYFYYYRDGRESRLTAEENDLNQRYQQQLDSRRYLDSIKKLKYDSIKPFNPNYLTDYKGYRIGLSVAQLDLFFAYREKGHYISSLADFQAVTKVSDSLLLSLTPYFQFPRYLRKTKVNIPEPRKNLNQADSISLIAVRGIGPLKAKRILNYKQEIRGFSTMHQLREIKLLSKDNLEELNERFFVIRKDSLSKISLNDSDFKSLLEVPYLDYISVIRIIEYRRNNGGFQNLRDLMKFEEIDSIRFERIALYLQLDNKNP